MMNELHLLRPYWLLALIPLIVLLWWFWHQKYHSRSWQAVCDPRLLPHILIGSEGQKKRWPVIAMSLTGMLVIFALAGPVWEKLEQPVFREQSALVIILDLSRSMDATDIKPTRLTRARHKIIDTLKQRREGQTALVVYANDAYTVSPLTQDADTMVSLVKTLSTDLMPVQGSEPKKALEHAEKLLTQAGVHSGNILLITDGINKSQMQSLENLVSNNNYSLSVLGVGTAQGAPISIADGGFLKDDSGDIVMPKLEPSNLSQLAQHGNGRYYTLTTDDRDLSYLLETTRTRKMDAKLEETDFLADRWKEEGPWLLLLVLPMAALAFRRGYLAVLVIFFLPVFPEPANAFEWDHLWQRADQKAAEKLKSNESTEPPPSPELFKDPEWQATANYRAGNYQQTVETLEGLENMDALYNKGNALAKMGKLPDAITAYEKALEIEPDHEDAKYNRDLVKKKLEEQQSSDQQQDGDQQEDSEDQKESDQQSSENQSSENSEDNPEGKDEQEQDQQQSQSDQDEESEQDQREANSDQKENKDSDEEVKQAENKDEQQNQEEKKQENTLAESQVNENEELTEAEQANEQWLRRIPDDPGGLLRRKFQYEHQRRLQQQIQQQRSGDQTKNPSNSGKQAW